MFYFMTKKIKEFYYLPVIFMTPMKAFTEGYEEFIKNLKQINLLRAEGDSKNKQ